MKRIKVFFKLLKLSFTYLLKFSPKEVKQASKERIEQLNQLCLTTYLEGQHHVPISPTELSGLLQEINYYRAEVKHEYVLP